jgi:hypothetical protein
LPRKLAPRLSQGLVPRPFSRFDACVATQPPGDRAVILACTVRSLREYVLEAECACGRCVHYPLNLLAASGLASLTMASVIVQLRCKTWGQRPVRAALLENGTAGMPLTAFDGSALASGWVVPLVGEA